MLGEFVRHASKAVYVFGKIKDAVEVTVELFEVRKEF
jgi:hypothetical protein